MNDRRIVCFHLFNDFSGSPKVLNMVLKGLLGKGKKVELVTSICGVLDELNTHPGIKRYSYPYHFSANPAVTMLRYTVIQLYTFFFAFRYLFRKDVVFYINTLLPVGPALAGRIMGKRVVYHYHENAFIKGTFYKVLACCMQRLAHEIICVSAYQASFLHRKKHVTVIPNAVPAEFAERLIPNSEEAFQRKTVLMLGSLKLYKSPLEFIELARRMPQFAFELVINDTQEQIGKFLEEHSVDGLPNLKIYPRQADVVPFYNRASMVLNLSNKRMFVETFGLTALEAMSAGLPVIVPTVGGIAEMVEDGVNGYKVDVQELERIICLIKKTLNDKDHYMRMANESYRASLDFKDDTMIERILTILNE